MSLAWVGLVLACDPIPVIFGDLLPGFFLSNFHAKPSGDLCAGPARRLASSGSKAPGHWGRHPASAAGGCSAPLEIRPALFTRQTSPLMAAVQGMPLDSGQREIFPNQFLHPVLFLEQLYLLGSKVCKQPGKFKGDRFGAVPQVLGCLKNQMMKELIWTSEGPGSALCFCDTG